MTKFDDHVAIKNSENLASNFEDGLVRPRPGLFITSDVFYLPVFLVSCLPRDAL